MSLLINKFNEIQEKPESYRRKLAIVIVVALSPFILAIWFSTFTSESVSLGQKEKEDNSYYYEADNDSNDNYNPFYVLGEVVGQASSDIKAAAGAVVEGLKSNSHEYNKNESR